MKIIVNGEPHELDTETLSDLLLALDYEGDWLATAVNGELVPAENRKLHQISENDRVEILSPMQGG
jgi:thiamine biosynthesis protein ThiS